MEVRRCGRMTRGRYKTDSKKRLSKTLSEYRYSLASEYLGLVLARVTSIVGIGKIYI
jgi:hypothetical protein